MSPIVIPNLADVEAWSGGSLLPPGRHLCRVDSVDDSQLSPGQHPQIIVDLRCTNGQHAGSTAKDWIVITEKTLGKVRQFLEALGMQIPQGDFYLPTDHIPGRPVVVNVIEEDGNEPADPANPMGPRKKRLRIQSYERVQGNGLTPPQNGNQPPAAVPPVQGGAPVPPPPPPAPQQPAFAGAPAGGNQPAMDPDIPF